MATGVKLNNWEQEALRERVNYLNKKLVMQGFRPITFESELVHRILEIAISKTEITDKGAITIKL